MPRRRIFSLWLRVRQVPLVLALLTGLTVVGLVWGHPTVPLPPVSGIGGAVGLLWFFPAFASCAIALVLNSPFPEREATVAIRSRLHTALLIAGLSALAAILLAWLAAVENGPHTPAQLVGGLFYWTALALVSARLFGPGSAWVLVMAALVPVTWFGVRPAEEGTFAWWVLPMLGGDGATVVAGALMLLAALAISTVSGHRIRSPLRRVPLSGSADG